MAKQSLSFEGFYPGTVVITDFVAPVIGRVVMDFNSKEGDILLHVNARYNFNGFQNVSCVKCKLATRMQAMLPLLEVLKINDIYIRVSA